MTSSSHDGDGFTPRPPDFELVITSKKNTKQKCYAGVAYANSSTGYTLKLKPGISINWDDEVYLTLWPAGTRTEVINKANADELGAAEPRPRKGKSGGREDEDIPIR